MGWELKFGKPTPAHWRYCVPVTLLRELHTAEHTSGPGKPMGRSLPGFKAWLLLKGFMFFGLFWLSKQLSKGGEGSSFFWLCGRGGAGKTFRGISWFLFYVLNSTQLPVCREVWGRAPLSKEPRVRSSCRPPISRLLFCKIPEQ